MNISTNKLLMLLFRRSGGWTLFISNVRNNYGVFFFQLNVLFLLQFMCKES